MTSHDFCRDQIGEFLDQTLDSTQSEKVAAHLEECATCAQMARELAGIRDTLRTFAPRPAPARLRQNVRSALQKEAEARSKPPFFSWRLPQLAWSGAASLTAIALIVLAQPFASDLRSPVREASEAPVASAPEKTSRKDPTSSFRAPQIEARTAKKPAKSNSKPSKSASPSKAIVVTPGNDSAPRPRNTSEKAEGSDAPSPVIKRSRPGVLARSPRPVSPAPGEDAPASSAPLTPAFPRDSGRSQAAPPQPESPESESPQPESPESTAPEQTVAPSPRFRAAPPSAIRERLRQESASGEREKLATTPLLSLQLNAVSSPASASGAASVQAPAPSISAETMDKSRADAAKTGPSTPQIARSAPAPNALVDSFRGRESMASRAPSSPKPGANFEASAPRGVQRFSLQLRASRRTENARVRLELPAGVRLLWPASNPVWSGSLSPEDMVNIQLSLDSARAGEKISVVVEQKEAGSVSKILETQMLVIPAAP